MDRYAAAWYILHQAVELGVNAILNGGDILDVTRPTSRAVNELHKMHKYLCENNIPMFLVQGNHDRTTPPWFDLFLSEDSDQLGGIHLLEGERVQLSGFSVYGAPEMPVDQLVEHLKTAPSADVLLTHIMVRDWIGYPAKTAFDLNDIPEDRYKYAVIGDVHKTVVQRYKKTMCISPGSIELGASDEATTKYFQLIDFGDDEVVSKTIPTRPVVHMEINSEEQMQEGLEKLKQADRQEALVYLTYDPTITGIVARVLATKTQPKTYIDMQTQVSEQEKHATDEQEDDGDELRSFSSFASEFSSNNAVLTAFDKVVSTDNAMDDIVEELAADVSAST